MGWYILIAVGTVCVVVGVVVGFLWSRRRPGSNGDPVPFSRVVGVCLLVLAISFGAELFYFQSEQRAQTNCQYRVNTALIDALNARNDASSEQQQKMTEMVAAIMTSKSRGDTQVAMQGFLDAANAFKLKREQNPYPQLPADCR